MNNVKHIRGIEQKILSLESTDSVEPGSIYFATDSGCLFIADSEGSLIKIKSDSTYTTEAVDCIILEGDTSDGIWHYKYYANGFCELFGHKLYDDVTWPKPTWGAYIYGWSLNDTKFPDIPVALINVEFKKAECYPKEKFTAQAGKGQNFLSTLSSAPLVDSTTGKFTCPGYLNCYRPEGTSITQSVHGTYWICGHVLSLDDITNINKGSTSYKNMLVQAIKEYESTLTCCDPF